MEAVSDERRKKYQARWLCLLAQAEYYKHLAEGSDAAEAFDRAASHFGVSREVILTVFCMELRAPEAEELGCTIEELAERMSGAQTRQATHEGDEPS